MTAAKIKTTSIKQLTWRYLALVVLIVIAGGAAMLALASRYLEQERANSIKHHHQVLAQDIGYLVDFYQNVVDSLAYQTEVLDILQFRDEPRALQWVEGTRLLLPDSIGVALVDRNGRVIGDPRLFNVGPRCLIDLRAILSGDDIGRPPVHFDNPSLAHFDIMRRVVHEGETIGVVFASFGLNVIQRRIAHLLGEGEYILVEDAAGTKIVTAGGDRGLDHHGRDHDRYPIPGTDWQLHYMPRLFNLDQILLSMALLGGGLLALVSAVIFTLTLRLGGIFNNDMRLIRDELRGVKSTDAFHRPTHVSLLRETEGITADISLLTRELDEYNKALKEKSEIDELTGIFNRRVFFERLQGAIAMAGRGIPSCLILLDLDYFKQVNDTYGHTVGDEVLKRFAGVLQRRLRVTDVGARIGGDEFAVILVNSRGEKLNDWYDNLCAQFARELQDLRDGLGLERPCEISAGAVLIHPEEFTNTTAAMEAADRNLYLSKEAGRGRLTHSIGQRE